MLPTKCWFIWESGFRGEDYPEIDQSETRMPVTAMFLMDWDELSNNYRRPSIHASYQVSVHWRKRFQRRICLEIDQSETRIACGGHVFLTYRDEMRIHYRGHSKDATYQMLVYFGKAVSKEKIF
jgi:hypothetical protein